MRRRPAMLRLGDIYAQGLVLSGILRDVSLRVCGMRSAAACGQLEAQQRLGALV